MRHIATTACAILVFTGIASLSAAPLPHFTAPNAIWNQDVSNAPTRQNSAAMMQHLEYLATLHTGSGKWGGDKLASNHDFQIDLSFYVLHANASTPTRAVVAYPTSGDYYTPDCDAPGAQNQFPVPVGGGIER